VKLYEQLLPDGSKRTVRYDPSYKLWILERKDSKGNALGKPFYECHKTASMRWLKTGSIKL